MRARSRAAPPPCSTPALSSSPSERLSYYATAMTTSSRNATAAAGAPQRLPWTGDDEADRLIAADPNALLIGFMLDQQVTVQKAFSGPLVIRERLGTLDPRRLAEMDPQRMRDAFATPPAVHRFPSAMADRVRSLCALLTTEYGGDASRIW